jgi:exodeoxyribonuclease VII large subunit
MTGATQKVYTVAELTRRIRTILEEEVGHVWLEGELSNVRPSAAGHFYFTLKDSTAQIRGVLFRGDQRGMKVTPRDGLLVRVFGQLSVYEPRGEYQLIIRQLEGAGEGALQQRFEALKEKLRAEGLFDAARKKPLPLLPQHVGIVTSSTGAAIRDILNVISRRFPNLHVVLWPVRVQGEGAASEIAAAIDGFNARGGMDVLIVGRGGGSLEDLWCFNEEEVARAIARSRIPVISAVGHEIDFTISDFAADVRAPTPSAAAELVVGTKEAFQTQVAGLTRRLARGAERALMSARARLGAAAGHHVFRQPEQAVRQHRQALRALADGLRFGLQRSHRDAVQRVDDAALRIGHRVQAASAAGRARAERAEAGLRAMNPLAVLQRGYSITWGADGRAVRSATGVRAGERVTTQLADGRLVSDVVETVIEKRRRQA